MNRIAMIFSAAVVAVVLAGTSLAAGETISATSAVPATVTAPTPANGLAALEQAAKDKKYLFIFFFKDPQEEATRAMRPVFDATLAKVADKAETYYVNLTNSSEKGIVAKYDAARAPMPLVMVVAPNGAIMAGLTIKFDEYTLLNSFNGPGAEKALKALQDRKFVVLTIQNAKTSDNDSSLKAAQEFKADKQYAQTEIIQIDPTVAAEAKFLGSLQIDRETKEAITVLLTPPGFRLGAFKGQTSKQALVDALKAATAPAGGCCPGGKCGSGGCK
jgi:hypothetical protein